MTSSKNSTPTFLNNTKEVLNNVRNVYHRHPLFKWNGTRWSDGNKNVNSWNGNIKTRFSSKTFCSNPSQQDQIKLRKVFSPTIHFSDERLSRIAVILNVIKMQDVVSSSCEMHCEGNFKGKRMTEQTLIKEELRNVCNSILLSIIVCVNNEFDLWCYSITRHRRNLMHLKSAVVQKR